MQVTLPLGGPGLPALGHIRASAPRRGSGIVGVSPRLPQRCQSCVCHRVWKWHAPHPPSLGVQARGRPRSRWAGRAEVWGALWTLMASFH